MRMHLRTLWAALGTGPWPWSDDSTEPVTGVAIDSRRVVDNDLFVAMKGESTDGHRFVGEAFRHGARAALVEQATEEVQRQADEVGAQLIDVTRPLDSGAPPQARLCFVVANTLRALQTLAAKWRNEHSACRVVGITGSVGKTTTTRLVAAVLSRSYETRASPENFNNEIGLPLSMLRLETGIEWLAQEMGMYAVGEIKLLASIARPEVGVVTNVGPTHLERLGTIERIAQAKSELVSALPLYGLAVLNGDDPRVKGMSGCTSAGRTLYYGLDHNNDLWADEPQVLGLEGIVTRIHLGGDSADIRLPLLGRHNVYAALAATAVGRYAGMPWSEIVAGLADRRAQARMTACPGIRGATVLDDSYNASPASMIAALELLSEMQGRRVAVLGGMLELGSYSDEGHRLVGRRAAECASVLITVGELGRLIAQEALRCGMPAQSVFSVADSQEAAELLEQVVTQGDYVLVKASHGIGLGEVVRRITSPAGPGQDKPEE